ncbi:hypothetical protein [Nocardia mexicana]|uniref:Uncharacterized protein n=1 Tax=Nocardia mexicana TaxID=279262 RepID=A0A370GI10_9NOCA|nr:hypothetical protein [Nocardia mexicana]RDI43287.1 hypothetical protein DFR68_12249 [Nocardia mexicana]
MRAEEDLIDAIVDAIESVDGLRPAAPLGLPNAKWLPLSGNRYAVDIGEQSVEIRVAATALPLQPLLDKLAIAIRGLLAETAQASTTLRIVVTELDAEAFGESIVT